MPSNSQSDPVESRLYLFGNVTIAQGLFKYSERAGLGPRFASACHKKTAKTRALILTFPRHSSANFQK